MTFSEQYGWCVYGINGDGKAEGIATDSEAEAVAFFWKLADSHAVGKIAFYNEDRTMWLDSNTRLVTMSRIDVGRARAVLARHRASVEETDDPAEQPVEFDEIAT